MSAIRLPAIAELVQGHVVARFARGVNIVFALVLAWMLAKLTWRLIPAEAPPAPSTPVPGLNVSPTSSAPSHQRADPAQLANLHLFGQAAPDNTESVANAPDTRLDLTLRGVLAADDEGAARAIIANPGGDEQVYTVGAATPGNATLKQIFLDRVILFSNGRNETLRLPKDDVAPGSGFGAEPSSFDLGVQGDVQIQDYATDQTSSYEPPPQDYGALRDQLVNNPETLQQQLGITPAAEQDKLIGLRINPPNGGQLAAQIGLKPDDVIVAVNGVRLNDPTRGVEAAQQLTQSSEVKLTVLRNGKEQQLSINMNEPIPGIN